MSKDVITEQAALARLLENIVDQFAQLHRRVDELQQILAELQPAVQALAAGEPPPVLSAGPTPANADEPRADLDTAEICRQIEALITQQGPLGKETIAASLQLTPQQLKAGLGVAKVRFDELLGKWVLRRKKEG